MGIAAYSIVYTISNILSTYTVYRLMKVFLGEPVCGGRLLVKRYAVYFLADTVAYLTFDRAVLNLAVKILGLSYLTENHEAGGKKKSTAVAFVYVCIAGVETLVVLFTEHEPLSLYDAGNYRSVGGTVCIVLFTFMVALLLERFDGIRQGEELGLLCWPCIILVPTKSIFMILKMFHKKNLTNLEIAGGILLELAVNFSVFYLYDALAKSIRLKSDNQIMQMEADAYKRENDYITESIESVRLLKHDMENHLNMLQLLLREAQYDEALRYTEDISGEIRAGKEHVRSGNLAVDGIMNFKIESARQRKIRVEIKVSIPQSVQIRGFDLVTILANMMDNAIEAAGEAEEGKREIRVAVEYVRGRLFVKESNTFQESPKACLDGTLVTSKKEPLQHGNGLRNIRAAVQRYHGSLDTWWEGEWFYLFILMFADIQETEKSQRDAKKSTENRAGDLEKESVECEAVKQNKA